MTRRPCVLLLCALAPLGVLTGCGSGSTTTKKHARTETVATVPLSARVRVAVIACKKEVATNAYIPASEKPAAKVDCQGVQAGDVAKVAALRGILRQACLTKVSAKVPASEQPAARTACDKVF